METFGTFTTSAVDTRRENVNWYVPPKGEAISNGQRRLAVLMDIRDELKKLNSVFRCGNFLDIPHKLDRIEKNTQKPVRKRKRRK